MRCHICNKHVNELPPGVYLQRINPKGEIGIFECYKNADKNEHPLISAIENNGRSVHAD